MGVVWIGGGSLGLLFAGKFALAGETASLVVRSREQLHSLEVEGLKLTDEHGRSLTASLSHIGRLDDRRALPAEPDWVAVMVKQTHLDDEFAAGLARWMERHAPKADVLCFQNGLGHVERLSRHIEAERIYAAVTTEGALRIRPNEVMHTGRGRTLIGHGVKEQAVSSPKLIKLCNHFERAGFAAFVSKNIKEAIWTKVLINAAINPLTALLRVENGKLLESHRWRSLMQEVVREGTAVARAEGVFLSEQVWEDVQDVCRRTAANRSSMLEDVLHNRPTEIESINGSICRLAEKHRLLVPVNRTLTRLVAGYNGSSQESRFSKEDDAEGG